MGTIRAQIRALETVDIWGQSVAIIESQSNTIIQKNKDQLYIGSLLATGEKLYLYNSFSYALDKEKQNPLPGFLHPDLYLTGQFFGGFKLRTTRDTYEVFSTDSKNDKLVLNYTEYIFGLTQQNKTDYAFGEFFSALKSYITAQTGLIFR